MDTINKLQVIKEKKVVLYTEQNSIHKSGRIRTVRSSKQRIKKSVTTDKEAKDAAVRGNMKQLFDTTRKLARKFKQADMPTKIRTE